MLRVGLTGSLGSGKSTVAALLREHGFHILEADAIARTMMQPGQPVFHAIAEHFGPSIIRADGSLDRPRLATLAFSEGRLNELNRIVHPPVIAEQERQMNDLFARDPHTTVVIESALIFEAEAWGTVPDWRRRFDRLILVTAPDELKIQRFLARILPATATQQERAAAERDARRRLAAQLPDSVKIPHCDFVIDNAGSLKATRKQVEQVATQLRP
jgi:dephospho-CoA kinase